MRFAEMCKDILNSEHRMACRKSYPTLTTTIRVKPNAQAGDIMYYYEMDAPQVPMVITKDLFDSDDWEVFDDISERLTIPNYMTMPSAKDFLRDLYDTVNSEWNGRFTKGFTEKPWYRQRMMEAIELRIIHGDKQSGKIVFTDIGEDIMKTL